MQTIPLLTQPPGTYWHFLDDSALLEHEDGRKVVVGETLTVEGNLQVYTWGLHAAKNVLSALEYAPSALLCLVTLGGTVLSNEDTYAASERTAIWMADVSEALSKFACFVAEDIVTRESATRTVDPLCFAGIKALKNHIANKTSGWELAELERQLLSKGNYKIGYAEDSVAWSLSRDGLTAAKYVYVNVMNNAVFDDYNAQLTHLLMQVYLESQT